MSEHRILVSAQMMLTAACDKASIGWPLSRSGQGTTIPRCQRTDRRPALSNQRWGTAANVRMWRAQGPCGG
eukprot:681116-Rhodomonas_salina.3